MRHGKENVTLNSEIGDSRAVSAGQACQARARVPALPVETLRGISHAGRIRYLVEGL
jgi:hypothetical protein